jgi:hypothetical protein
MPFTKQIMCGQSFTEQIMCDDPDKYEMLLESRILGKQLQMKLNQYNALQSQYNSLLQRENDINRRNRLNTEVKKECLDKNSNCPAWKSCCPGGTGSNATITCGQSDCPVSGKPCIGTWMKETCPKTCNLCDNLNKSLEPGSSWNDLQNKNYQMGMVSSPTQSTDDWKFLGKSDSLTDCKLKAVQDNNTFYSSIVYYPSDFGNDWSNSCFGGIKGKNINSGYQSKTITSLAPNGTTALGGDEGEKIVKEMKLLQRQIAKQIKKINKFSTGLDNTKTLISGETISKREELEKIVSQMETDRYEIDKLLKQPDESAEEEDSNIRQISSYTTYSLWLLLGIVSIYMAYYVYSRESYEISMAVYVFIAVWIIIIGKYYYKTFINYGDSFWNYISNNIPYIRIF